MHIIIKAKELRLSWEIDSLVGLMEEILWMGVKGWEFLDYLIKELPPLS